MVAHYRLVLLLGMVGDGHAVPGCLQVVVVAAGVGEQEERDVFEMIGQVCQRLAQTEEGDAVGR
jgi:hypothetical protein